MPNAVTFGVHHIGFTIPDLAKTRAFFVDILGFDQIGEVPDYPAVFLSDGETMITLWQAENPDIAVPFDRKNVIGLHHFAMKVRDAEALVAIHQKLRDVEECEIEFPPEPLGDGEIRHMMCFIPGGIRMEFIALAAE